MPAYEYNQEQEGFIKECRCGLIIAGGPDEDQSKAIFAGHFEHDTQTADGFRSLCRDCTSNVRNKSRGVKPHDRRQLLKDQDFKCAICSTEISFEGNGQPHSAHVDHNKMTGNVRGILCAYCNRGIGLLRDDATILNKAAAYIRRDNEDN